VYWGKIKKKNHPEFTHTLGANKRRAIPRWSLGKRAPIVKEEEEGEECRLLSVAKRGDLDLTEAILIGGRNKRKHLENHAPSNNFRYEKERKNYNVEVKKSKEKKKQVKPQTPL